MNKKIFLIGLAILISVAVVYAAQPTVMSFQGKVTNTAGNPISSGDLRVTVSTQGNDCTTGVLFDYTYTGIINNGLFNILLGDNSSYPGSPTLELNYNQDYWICTFVNEGGGEQQVGNPSRFRGGQGQIDISNIAQANDLARKSVNQTITGNWFFNKFLRAQSYFPASNTAQLLLKSNQFIGIQTETGAAQKVFAKAYGMGNGYAILKNYTYNMGDIISQGNINLKPSGGSGTGTVVVNGSLKVGTSAVPSKIKMYSPNGNAWLCGPEDNTGSWKCIATASSPEPKTQEAAETTETLTQEILETETGQTAETQTIETTTETATAEENVPQIATFSNCQTCVSQGFWYCPLDDKCYPQGICPGPGCCLPKCGSNCIAPKGTC